MRENTDQKNSKYGHFSRSARNKNYATVISQPLNGGIKSKNIKKLTKKKLLCGPNDVANFIYDFEKMFNKSYRNRKIKMEKRARAILFNTGGSLICE